MFRNGLVSVLHVLLATVVITEAVRKQPGRVRLRAVRSGMSLLALPHFSQRECDRRGEFDGIARPFWCRRRLRRNHAAAYRR